jgi:6-phosphogluconate dehydrogenase
MEIGMIGIGRMGSGMARRLLKSGHQCTVYDQNREKLSEIVQAGAIPARDLKEFTHLLRGPRIIWIMLPAEIVDKILAELTPLLSAGDIVIDGGNSFYQDDLRRALELKGKGIYYMDVGTSGGVYGEDRGYCLMCGGEWVAFETLAPMLKDLAPGVETAERTRDRSGPPSSAENGYLHCGPAGAGHFVKMVHNGIEYGMMASLAEGLNILKGANIGKADRMIDAETAPVRNAHFYQYDFHLPDITELWRRGSVVSSWLLDLTAEALAKNPALENFSGRVSDSGEGRWTIQAAIDEGIPTPTLSAALFERFSSQGKAIFGDQVLSAMRFEFGGHVEKNHQGIIHEQ